MAVIGTDIKIASQFLAKGELVAIPTETVYGLAANAMNAGAVARIFAVKNRPSFDPLIVHVPDFEKAGQLAKNIPPQAAELAAKFWPGPLTLLLDKSDGVPDLVTAGLPRVGLRCPQHPLTLELLRIIEFPLAAPSANPFGYISPTDVQHVQQQLGQHIPYILNGGPCKVGIESTIIGWEDGLPVIYRLGGCATDEIEKVTGPLREIRHSTSRPQAPGQLTSHYAPRKPLELGRIDDLALKHKGKRLGILSFRGHEGIIGPDHYVLSPTGNLEEAASKLFAFLRILDESEIDLILAEPVPDAGLGRAINDRLRRAAVTADP